jgi:hypothetical protein
LECCKINEKVYIFSSEDNISRELKTGGNGYFDLKKIDELWGKDLKHLDNHIWPGTDSVLLIIEEAEKAKQLIDNLRNYKENMEYEVPFFVIVVNVEEFI